MVDPLNSAVFVKSSQEVGFYITDPGNGHRGDYCNASEGSERDAPIVNQPRSLQCQDCSTLKKEKEQLREQLDILKATKNSLQDGKKEIEHKYERLKESSDKLTEQMVSVFNERSDFENINDEFSNTRLSKRFRHVYDNAWTDLSEWIEDNIPDLEEIDRISKLTFLMKDGYDRCIKMAEGELRTFLFLGDEDRLPTRKEDPALYNLRRKYGQTEVKREGIAKIIFEELTEKEEFKSMLPKEEQAKSKGLDMMRKFFCDYIECCWLMTISHQRLVLDFEVIGYKCTDNYIKDRFTVFSCQDNVVDKTHPKDTVVEVVWPSVELENGSGIYAKGDVIIVNVGKDQPNTDRDGNACNIRNGAPLLESVNNTSGMQNDTTHAESNKNASGMGNDIACAEIDTNTSDVEKDKTLGENDGDDINNGDDDDDYGKSDACHLLGTTRSKESDEKKSSGEYTHL
ncbi:hypothetical protein ACF0H5_014785 [Mactra antiquata]